MTRPEPADYLAQSIVHGLHHGLPARRRLGPAWALVARRGLPTAPLATALRRLPKHVDPDLDRLLDQLAGAWAELAAHARDLPREAPALTAVAVQRSAARTVFVLGEPGRLLLVAKLPQRVRAGLDSELAALAAARPADVAPRHLGDVAGAAVQEGLRGAAVPLPTVWPGTAAALPRGTDFDQLGVALGRLAEVTAKPGDLNAQLFEPVDLALGSGALTPHAQRLVTAARTDLRNFRVAVLQHGDLSAQNWMVCDGRFSGLVDWETAVHDGVPGFDVLHAAVSMLEHGVGLARWSQRHIEQAFASAWTMSPLFDGVRAAHAASVRAAGVPDQLVEPLQLVFFARRLGRRLRSPDTYTIGPAVVAAAVEVVCRS